MKYLYSKKINNTDLSPEERHLKNIEVLDPSENNQRGDNEALEAQYDQLLEQIESKKKEEVLKSSGSQTFDAQSQKSMNKEQLFLVENGRSQNDDSIKKLRNSQDEHVIGSQKSNNRQSQKENNKRQDILTEEDNCLSKEEGIVQSQRSSQKLNNSQKNYIRNREEIEQIFEVVEEVNIKKSSSQRETSSQKEGITIKNNKLPSQEIQAQQHITSGKDVIEIESDDEEGEKLKDLEIQLPNKSPALSNNRETQISDFKREINNNIEDQPLKTMVNLSQNHVEGTPAQYCETQENQNKEGLKNYSLANIMDESGDDEEMDKLLDEIIAKETSNTFVKVEQAKGNQEISSSQNGGVVEEPNYDKQLVIS